MIPKVIHYCWFGGNPLPELAQKCIASWKKYCPDYKIIEWNESNIDILSVDYMREAYQEKAWGFVPDVARLQIIYENGGIYLDTDVEMIRSFDDLIIDKAFAGIEDDMYVALGLGFGAEKGNDIIKKMLDDYKDRHFIKPDGTLDKTPSPQIQTALFKDLGLHFPVKEKKIINNVVIYPREYFCPKSFKTGKLTITPNTYSIHHYDGSWLSDEDKLSSELRYSLGKFMPTVIAGKLAKFITIVRLRGIYSAVKETINWIIKREKTE